MELAATTVQGTLFSWYLCEVSALGESTAVGSVLIATAAWPVATVPALSTTRFILA